MNARVASWDEAFLPGKSGPFSAALAIHALMFVWNPVIMKSGEMKPISEYLQVRYEERLPDIPAVKPDVKKPAPKPVVKKKETPKKKAKKSGLSLAAKPKPVTVAKKQTAAPKKFVSKIEIPKYTPQVKDEIIAASPSPGIAMPAKTRMQQALAPPPRLNGKSRGIPMDDIPFKLTDKGAHVASAVRAVAIPVGEERGDVPMLPPAAVFSEAPRGLKTVQGYRDRPGLGTGSGELRGRNKSGGYFGVVKAPVYVSGELTGGGGTGKAVKAAVTGQGFEIGGPIGDRKIVRRRLPEYPTWAEEKGISAAVQIFFTVRPDGTIRTNLRVDRSSGYPELDQLAMQALLQWKFSSTSARSDDNTAWGVITFRFTLS